MPVGFADRRDAPGASDSCGAWFWCVAPGVDGLLARVDVDRARLDGTLQIYERGRITSQPTHGRKTSGITTEPSACW